MTAPSVRAHGTAASNWTKTTLPTAPGLPNWVGGATHALLFDVFGTLVDWRGSLIGQAIEISSKAGVEADWAAVVDDWRRAYQPALDRARAGSAWRDLDALQAETLADVLDGHGVTLPAEERARLVLAWRRLRPWPDTRPGLERLRAEFRTATLSNAHVALLVDLFRFADLRVDAILSAQLADSYKPDPRVYLRGAAARVRARPDGDGGRAWARPRRRSAGGAAPDLHPPAT